MTDTITCECRQDCCICTYTGRFAPKPFIEGVRSAHDFCRENGCTRLVFDHRDAKGEMGHVERFEISEEVARFWDRVIRVAMLARPDQLLSDRFGQKVAQNRGVAMRAFTSLETAIEWLQK